MTIAVVGAGAVGLFCARALARRGGDVIVFDSDPEGARSASRAAAGMLAPFSETLTEGEGAHPRALELGAASLRLWREAASALGIAAFPHPGARLLGGDRARGEALARVKTSAEALGFSARWAAGGALDLPDEGVVDPAEALAALARGLDIRRASVIAVRQSRLDLDGGASLNVDHVVLAPGAWATPALIDAAPALGRVTAMKGALMALESDSVPAGRVLRGEDVYLIGRGEGRVLVGATMEGGKHDLAPDPDALDRLTAAAARIAPALRNAKRLAAWAGVRPMSPDWAPLIGRSGDAFVACGHSRNGWLNAPITAEILAAEIFGDSVRAPNIESFAAAFAADRFEGRP